MIYDKNGESTALHYLIPGKVFIVYTVYILVCGDSLAGQPLKHLQEYCASQFTPLNVTLSKMPNITRHTAHVKRVNCLLHLKQISKHAEDNTQP